MNSAYLARHPVSRSRATPPYEEKHSKSPNMRMKVEECASMESSCELDYVEICLDDLSGCMTESEFEKTPKPFLPHGSFSHVFNRECLMRLILPNKRHPARDDMELVDFILSKAQRLFLITFSIRHKMLHAAMSLFAENEFCDEDLPIPEMDGETLRKECETHVFVRMQKRVPHKSKRPWSVHFIQAFQKAQWEFLAPIFSTSKENHELGRLIVPFIDIGKTRHRGAHGTVSKYTIHPDHFDNSNHRGASNVVAVKAFKHSGDKVALDWKREVNALSRMNALHEPHIVRFITAFQRGNPNDLEYYVIFEWADGGNLGDFWRAHPKPELNETLVRWVMEQLHGLSKALAAAHNLITGQSYRHGDLKPANILWFKSRDSFGILKVGDWGEAKIHNEVTSLRQHNTSARYGTRRYEPPETGLQSTQPQDAPRVRSRLYDVWSFGCITLEFLIWLLYGHEGLKQFNQGDYGPSDMFYEITSEQEARVHPIALHWMNHMAKDPLCRPGHTALGDLLDLIRSGLLVVEIPGTGAGDPSAPLARPESPFDNTGTSSTTATSSHPRSDRPKSGPSLPEVFVTEADPPEVRSRTSSNGDLETRYPAARMKGILEQILHSTGRHNYWPLDARVRLAPVHSSRLTVAKTPPRNRAEVNVALLRADQPEEIDYHHPDLDPEDWTFVVDNAFAGSLMSSLHCEGDASFQAAKLCSACQARKEDILKSRPIVYNTTTVKKTALSGICELCDLVWTTFTEDFTDINAPEIRVERTGTTLRMNGAKRPALTLMQRNGPQSQALDIQIGYPELSEAGGPHHLSIIRGWLSDCDQTHQCQPGFTDHEERSKYRSRRLPTRLLNVGTEGEQTVRLQQMHAQGNQDGNSGDWIALSYRWGQSPPFSTTRGNIKKYLSGMEVALLPKTFQDAIRVTRALGKRYLWIDSICIIQGEDGDFNDEFGHMEDVYSGAYCVIAASCATDQQSGFLEPRPNRKSVRIPLGRSSDGGIYICQVIDNFRDHVLNGPLNKRAWVLQERALARRTVFFTKHQTYYECGHGVRCESMAKMTNVSAAFLGDPDFPKILSPAKHGERVVRFQELYEQYSRLELTASYDRPFAIASLQQRLLSAMGVKGGFGILDDVKNRGLLRRSLLWRRGRDTQSLTPISFPRGRKRMPSWSWMAYSGGIDYFRLSWLGFEWQDVDPPWSERAHPSGATFRVTVRECTILPEDEDHKRIVYDDPEQVDRTRSVVVVLGIQKPWNGLDQRHYVLVVKPKAITIQPDLQQYERIGAGFLDSTRLRTGSRIGLLV